MKQLFIALFLISTQLLCGEANESKEAFNVTFDLSFYTVSGKVCMTTRTKNFAEESIAMTDETCRPKVDIAPQRDGQWGLVRLSEAATLQPFDVYATSASQEDFIAFDMTGMGVGAPLYDASGSSETCYDLQGRRIDNAANSRGIVIIRSSNGKVRKALIQ